MSSADSYDELGRLRTKKRHGGADTETYAYNIRNWTTQINSGSFTEKLYYNTNPLNARPCYNGNISYSTWTYNNGSTTAEKGYAYEYDELNRLVNAEYQQGSSSQATGSFNEQFTYDKMGNILTLQRKKDNALIDNLTFNYKNNNSSNQLDYITDAAGTRGLSTIKEYQGLSAATAGEFQYDANGNLIKDADREIVTIRYNLLNLPDTIQFKNGNQIINLYDAGGQKLRTDYYTYKQILTTPIVSGQVMLPVYNPVDYDFTGTIYVGNTEYDVAKTRVEKYGSVYYDDVFRFNKLHNPEGYVTGSVIPDINNYRLGIQYNYYRRDHLGNNREVWCGDYYAYTGLVPATTLQRTQYYPSGLPWAEEFGAGVQNKKYNGKEFVEMHGLDEYDSEARWYQPAIMRTTTVDPQAEDYYSISPYVWCGNNPIKFVDPTGMSLQDTTIALPQVECTAKMPGWIRDMQAAIFLGIYQAQNDFWDHPVTQGVLMVLPIISLEDITINAASKLLKPAIKALTTAEKIANLIGKLDNVAGVYIIKTKGGKIYVGQSIDVARRLAEHLKSDRFITDQIVDIKVTEVIGDKSIRESFEQAALDAKRIEYGNKNILNKRNPVGGRPDLRNIPVETGRTFNLE